jgi:transposase-like protein
MATPLKCPYCGEIMKLICGNPCFTDWICRRCKKEYEYNVIREEFSDETSAAAHLLAALGPDSSD